MAAKISRKRRVLFALLAATVLVAITSVPSMVSAAPQKKYSLAVSPTTATVGQATTITATITNETPPGTNSNPSSFYVTVPFPISGAITLPPTVAQALAGSSNANLSATVGIDPTNSSRILVKSLDPVNKGQSVKLTFTATPASCTLSNYYWVTDDLVKVANGASLNGDTFAPTSGSLTVKTTVSCGPPVLSVTKTADAENVVAGDPIGYTITATNSGAGSATGVTLTDELPTDAGLSWLIDGGTGAGLCSITNGTLSCSFGDMAGSSNFTVHVSSPTTEATAAGSPVQNTASIRATNVTPDPAPASASITVFAEQLDCNNTSDTFDMGTTGRTTIEYLDPADCTTPIPFTFSYDPGTNTFTIDKQTLAVALKVTPVWPPEQAPTDPNLLQISPTEVTPPTPFHPVQWCNGDGTTQQPYTPPSGESWCTLSQAATNVGPGGGGQLIQVTDILLLFGDASGHR
jgi:uncharacterized repeat protein (TIGR01451 family)